MHPTQRGDGRLPDTPAVRAALMDPDSLLAAAAAGGKGWADAYGGPEGVALLADEIRRQLDRQARQVAELRAVAVAELLRDRSLASAGKLLGIGKTAVHKINRSALGSTYERLLKKGQW